MAVVNRSEGLWFSIHIEEEEFIAFVTSEVLHTYFNASQYKKNPLQCSYSDNQEKISKLARRKFLNGARRPIYITRADFE